MRGCNRQPRHWLWSKAIAFTGPVLGHGFSCVQQPWLEWVSKSSNAVGKKFALILLQSAACFCFVFSSYGF